MTLRERILSDAAVQVTIERKRGEPEACRYAPRDSNEKDRKLRFYAETKAGWHVVTLEAIRPQGGIFVDDSMREVETVFSDSPPKKIEPCRLLPPPCYESEDKANQNRPENWPDWLPAFPESQWDWKRVYWRVHDEALWVKPDHEGEPRGPTGTRKGGKLRNLLARLRWAARAARRREVAAWEQEIRKRAELPLKKLKYKDEEQRHALLEESRQQLEACQRYYHSIESLTLADFKRGCWPDSPGEDASPLNAFLVEDWVKRKKVDLNLMRQEAETCRAWIKLHCRNRTAHVADRRHGMNVNRIELILRFDTWNGLDVLLARVTHKVTFRDESVLFLTACEEREPSAQERAEVETVAGVRTPTSADSYIIECRVRKGRPRATVAERKRDARLAAAWRSSGERKIKVFAQEHGVDANEVRRAINSDAHRRARKVVVKPG